MKKYIIMAYTNQTPNVPHSSSFLIFGIQDKTVSFFFVAESGALQLNSFGSNVGGSSQCLGLDSFTCGGVETSMN